MKTIEKLFESRKRSVFLKLYRERLATVTTKIGETHYQDIDALQDLFDRRRWLISKIALYEKILRVQGDN